MRKLLAAGFARLKKDKIFWIGVAFMILIALLIPLKNYASFKESGFVTAFDSYFFGYTLFTGMIAAVFSSLFIGTEHSDGTMRNKIVVGHTRTALYFSNFIINAAASLMTNLAFIVAVSAVGIPLFGTFTMEPQAVVQLFLASVLMTLAFTAIFTALGMLIQNKTILAIVSILGVLAMYLCAGAIDQTLKEPEFYQTIDFSGDIVEAVPNPGYLQPEQRAVYQFFLDFIPTGQVLQIAGRTAPHPWQMQLYSLLIIVVTTTGGIFFFRKKDLK